MFFHALTFAVARESCLNTRLSGRGIKLLLTDTFTVNVCIEINMCDPHSCIFLMIPSI